MAVIAPTGSSNGIRAILAMISDESISMAPRMILAGMIRRLSPAHQQAAGMRHNQSYESNDTDKSNTNGSEY